MLSVEDNVRLTQVGPDTPGGKLMRMYWQPIAASRELDDSPFRTKEVRVLGEDLVLYRDRQGKLGLIERYCSHRRVNLAIGVVEDDGIRCQYHGWKFNAEGECVERVKTIDKIVKTQGKPWFARYGLTTDQLASMRAAEGWLFRYGGRGAGGTAKYVEGEVY